VNNRQRLKVYHNNNNTRNNNNREEKKHLYSVINMYKIHSDMYTYVYAEY